MISLIISVACIAVSIAAMWMIFEKAGEKGWKSLIPIYNNYMLYKIAHNSKFVQYVLSVCLMCISTYGLVFGIAGLVMAPSAVMIALSLISFIGFLATIIWMFVLTYQVNADLFESFGYDRLFALLIFISPAIFVMYCVIGFDQSREYNPVKEEPVYKNVVLKTILCFVLVFVASIILTIVFAIGYVAVDPDFSETVQTVYQNINNISAMIC